MFNLTSPNGHSAWDYADSVLIRLAAIETAIENAQGNDPIFRRLPFNIQCDASGNGLQEFTVPRGTMWTLKAIAFTGSVSGAINTYVTEIAGATLIKTNPSSLYVSDSFDEDQIAEKDVKLIVSIVGQVASSVVSGNIRLLQYETSNNDPKPVR